MNSKFGNDTKDEHKAQMANDDNIKARRVQSSDDNNLYTFFPSNVKQAPDKRFDLA